MPYDPHRHHRRTIRLRGYDYSQAGAYFVTICTHARQPLFMDAHFRQIAEEQWRALGHAGLRGVRGPRVAIDAFVVMPDHVHGIIIINDHADDDPRDAPITGADPDLAHGSSINVVPGSLGAIVRSYKAAVARRLNLCRRRRGAAVWQRGYYEQIIRDARHFAAVQRYIVENPLRYAEGSDALDRLLERMSRQLS